MTATKRCQRSRNEMLQQQQTLRFWVYNPKNCLDFLFQSSRDFLGAICYCGVNTIYQHLMFQKYG
jgi:hypothetical protein